MIDEPWLKIRGFMMKPSSEELKKYYMDGLIVKISKFDVSSRGVPEGGALEKQKEPQHYEM
ncbi:hypothetical protein TIFTF001_016059 [Ficus carica]|uniref:Uncharacterized protein n=1 Tax=Ficus carica TaxID=3494 RepID=A0AA88A899_FICCA|nr:hypothetical protein TIFTF001_016059 [Ficus carica]